LIGWKNGMNQYSLGSATIADPKTMMEIAKSNGEIISPLKTTAEIAKEIGISEKSMKNRLYAERSEIPISFAISGVVFNSATVAELGYLKGGDRKSDEFQKLTVGLRSTKEIAHDIDRG